MRFFKGYGSLSALMALVCTFALLASAHAVDGRILAGAKIPLSVKPVQGKEPIEVLEPILNRCMYEAALASLAPSLVNVTVDNDNALVESSMLDTVENMTGDNEKWTNTQAWYGGESREFDYKAWATPTKSEIYHLAFSAHTYGVDDVEQESTVMAELSNDQLDVDVRLQLEAAMPAVVMESNGGKSCRVNEWGRNGCVEAPLKINSFHLVIPKAVQSSVNWVNATTGNATLKNFNPKQYADCVLYAWEHL